ncbi:hypothetical protein L211DRAFT_61389 [Terfezia boudieri ATCC MYA-4762]|uniref:Uncharacterized protein n=1 Tax=Terfezia boudieri ATCC MYA-4762 TaxID=1051890 RepID=A0A3N4LSI0_9PEZI|nr:hypothetical protein L211DRAFT_61389 [Terfezia boudieri ATCC MYA-4762]
MKFNDSANIMSSAILVAMIVNMKSLSLYHLKLGWELSWVASLEAHSARFFQASTTEWIARYIIMQLLNAALLLAAAYLLVARWSEYDETIDHCYRALPEFHISNGDDASRHFVRYAWVIFFLTLIQLPNEVGFDCKRIPRWFMRRLDWKLNTKSEKLLLFRLFGRRLWALFIMASVCLLVYFVGQVLVDVWAMFILNKPLLGDDEIKWGYGQVMAMFLLLTVIYGMLLDCIKFYRSYPNYHISQPKTKPEKPSTHTRRLNSGYKRVSTWRNAFSVAHQSMHKLQNPKEIQLRLAEANNGNWIEKDWGFDKAVLYVTLIYFPVFGRVLRPKVVQNLPV